MDGHGTELPVERILIVGAGGLGVPAALCLGRLRRTMVIGLIDPEKVELSNLARQVIYATADIGKPKVLAAAQRLVEESAGLIIETMPFKLDSANAADLIREYHFVIDATDDPATKFLINDACLATRRPFVYGGVLGLAGQAMTVIPGRTACLRCLFEEPPGDAEILGCRDAGIIGPVAGVIGAIQATEAIAFVGGQIPQLAGTVLSYDAAGPARLRLVGIAPRPDCECGAGARISDDDGWEPRKSL